MARVTGPLHSDQASGQINGNMVFSKWKGRPYVRSLVIPANPKSAKQTGIRAMMKYLAQIWAIGGPKAGGTWTAPALAKTVSAFNEFVGYNMLRWRNFKGITLAYPAAQSVAGAPIAGQTLTGAIGQVSIEATATACTAGAAWALAIFRDTAAITNCSWDNCIAVVPGSTGTAADITYVDTPLAAGAYHYRTAWLSIDGQIGTPHADASANAT